MQTSRPQLSKTKLPPQEDWFELAFSTPGSVDTCLSAVEDQLTLRARFCEMLRAHLSGSTPKSLDAISALGQDITAIAQTLKNRLATLSTDRPGAWFRPAPHAVGGPFCKQLLPNPIFGDWARSDTELLPPKLLNYWRSGLHQLGESACIWTKLLQVNARWVLIDRLAEPWAEIRLSQYPDKLPAPLESAGLKLFLQNVAKELSAQRERLDELFHQLLHRSQEFWRQHPQCFHKKTAQDAREEFRKRRLNDYLDRDMGLHLNTLGLDRPPSAEQLKERYRELAKKWHPDISAGKEEQFKQLTISYTYLLKHCQAKPSI